MCVNKLAKFQQQSRRHRKFQCIIRVQVGRDGVMGRVDATGRVDVLGRVDVVERVDVVGRIDVPLL